MGSSYQSWGRNPKAEHIVRYLSWRSEKLPVSTESVLPYGVGRSYGDVCLNDKNSIISSERLKHIINFDKEGGIITCEAGITLGELLEIIIPYGWFLPVSPGTKYVTIGGAIANDIHGKNHHRAGTFGSHVNEFWLKRSDGSETYCSPHQQKDLFLATIGGLGLTGFISTATLRLKKVSSAFIDVENLPIQNLDDFFSISRETDMTHEYTVAWIDCLTPGRGIFIRGNHSQTSEIPKTKKTRFIVPFNLPSFALSKFSVKSFNHLYYTVNKNKIGVHKSHYNPFFYPLDSVLLWNRIYGKRGFFQFQCLIPPKDAKEGIFEILQTVSKAGKGSFLAVLKNFGDIPSAGMLSFPRPGSTLCLDFPHEGESTLRLMQKLHSIVTETGGSIYPAKDACMTPDEFNRFYPQWNEFKRYKDPKFSSTFWRRVTCEQ